MSNIYQHIKINSWPLDLHALQNSTIQSLSLKVRITKDVIHFVHSMSQTLTTLEVNVDAGCLHPLFGDVIFPKLKRLSILRCRRANTLDFEHINEKQMPQLEDVSMEVFGIYSHVVNRLISCCCNRTAHLNLELIDVECPWSSNLKPIFIENNKRIKTNFEALKVHGVLTTTFEVFNTNFRDVGDDHYELLVPIETLDLTIGGEYENTFKFNKDKFASFLRAFPHLKHLDVLQLIYEDDDETESKSKTKFLQSLLKTYQPL